MALNGDILAGVTLAGYRQTCGYEGEASQSPEIGCLLGGPIGVGLGLWQGLSGAPTADKGRAFPLIVSIPLFIGLAGILGVIIGSIFFAKPKQLSNHHEHLSLRKIVVFKGISALSTPAYTDAPKHNASQKFWEALCFGALV